MITPRVWIIERGHRHSHIMDIVSLTDTDWLSQLLLSCSLLPDLEWVKQVLDHPLAGTNFRQVWAPGVRRVHPPGLGQYGRETSKSRNSCQGIRTTDNKRYLTEGSPVGWACYTNRVDLAKMLVGHGADPVKTWNVPHELTLVLIYVNAIFSTAERTELGTQMTGGRLCYKYHWVLVSWKLFTWTSPVVMIRPLLSSSVPGCMVSSRYEVNGNFKIIPRIYPHESV